MVGLNCLGSLGSTFDHVCVKRSLRQEVDALQFRRFIVEDVNEFVTDDFTFLFRIADACQFVHETFFRINTDDVQAEFAHEAFHNLITFAFAQQAVVNKNTSQLRADCFVQQYADYA